MKRRPHSEPSLATVSGPTIPTTFDPNRWLTAERAAAYLGIVREADGEPSVAAIRNLVYRGVLKAYKPFGRLLFDRYMLDRQIEASGKEGR